MRRRRCGALAGCQTRRLSDAERRQRHDEPDHARAEETSAPHAARLGEGCSAHISLPAIAATTIEANSSYPY